MGANQSSAAGDVAAAWRQRVADTLEQTTGASAPPLLAQPTDEADALATIDWTGLPARVVECLGRDRALRVLDWAGKFGDEGRRRLQEEYVEWRVVRDGPSIRRVELTTELAAHWRVLAAHDPEHTLDLVARFAGLDSVPVREVYGDCNPFAEDAAEVREQAFVATMLEGRSPYNSGAEAICCMVQPTNTLGALIKLAVAAAGCGVVNDSGGRRSMTCAEAIPGLKGAAEDGRASDPLLVERIARLAFERRPVAFNDPLGIYIAAVEDSRLRTPHGDPVPAEWFSFERGLSAKQSPDGRPRYQRMSLEVPRDEKFALSDLVDVATEQPIRSGGQIAELVDLVLLLCVGERDPRDDERETVDPGKGLPSRDCKDINGHAEAFDLADE